jgi:hypothetical protein
MIGLIPQGEGGRSALSQSQELLSGCPVSCPFSSGERSKKKGAVGALRPRTPFFAQCWRHKWPKCW